MNKKLFAILGVVFLVLVGILGFLIYKKYTGGSAVVVPSDTQTVVPTTTPNITKAIRITDDQVISPTLLLDGSGVSFLSRQGQLYQAKFSTSTLTAISLDARIETTIPIKSDIVKVLWPRTGYDFLVERNVAGVRQWSYFNAQTVKYTDLPVGITSVAWAEDSKTILYVWKDKKSYLKSSNPDGTAFTTIAEFFNSNNEIVPSPDGKNIAFYRNSSSESSNGITVVSRDGKTFQSPVREGYNKGVSWSPDSSKFVFARRNTEGKFELWLTSLSAGTVVPLKVQSYADKVVWNSSGDTIFVAAKDSNGENDTFYKIDVLTQVKKEINPDATVQADTLFLSSDETVLFFRSTIDEGLYALQVN